MLKQIAKLQEDAATLHHTADQIGSEAVAAVETLKGCREFVTKTVASLTEKHEAVVEGLTSHHTHMMGQFSEMLTRIDETISKLEGAANG
jgi:hypothetical protein